MTNPDDGHSAASCPDMDLLVELAASGSPRATLRHLLECSECGARLDVLADLSAADRPDPAHAAALAERVLRALEPEVTRRGSALSRWGFTVGSAVAAAAAGFAGVLFLSTGGLGASLPAALAGAMITAFLPFVEGVRARGEA